MTFEEQLKILRASRHLHRKWYLQTYPEVAAEGVDPAEHYLREGAIKGYSPGKFFDTQLYLSLYPDVAESGLNPLVHYERIGAGENRIANPTRAAMRERQEKERAIRRAEQQGNGQSPGYGAGPAGLRTIRTIPPRTAATAAEGHPTGGLPKVIRGIDFTKRRNFLLFSAIHAAPDGQIAKHADLTRTLCRLITDLGLTWHQGGSGPEPATAGARPVVVVLTTGGITPETDPRLLDLARTENPGADILICAPEGVIGIQPPRGCIPGEGFAEGPDPGPAAGLDRSQPVPSVTLARALALAGRAYTHDAPAGMDALIRGVPLTVTGDPFYAGWGFTDDRAALSGRARQLDATGFLTILFFLLSDDPAPSGNPAAGVLDRIIATYRGGGDRTAAVLPDRSGLMSYSAARTARAETPDDPRYQAHVRARAALNSAALAACQAGTWPAFLENRVRAHLSSGTRREMVERLIGQAGLMQSRTGAARRLLAALICGLAHAADHLDQVMPEVARVLGSGECARLMSTLARVSGLPSATLVPGWMGDAGADTGAGTAPPAAAPDDLMLAVMQILPGQGADGLPTLLDWAQQCQARGHRGAALQLLECCFLTGRCPPEALALAIDLLWQGFEVKAATELLTLAARCWPDWQGGHFPTLLAQLTAMRGDAPATLDALIHAAHAGAAETLRKATFDALLSRHYPGLPLTAALERAATDVGRTDEDGSRPGPDPLARARYLSGQHRPAEAQALLAELPEAEADSDGARIEMSTALALQGRFEQADTLLGPAPEGACFDQAVRLAALTGDTARARALASTARRRKTALAPATQRLLHQTRSDFAGTMEAWRADPVAALAARHLGTRLARSLPALTAGTGQRLLVAMVDTPGGDAAWSGLLPRLARACAGHELQIACDRGLAPVLARSFPQIAFVPCARQPGPMPVTDRPGRLPAAELLALFDAEGWDAAAAADRVALITDLAADLADSPAAFDPRPTLLPDPARVAAWRARLDGLPRPLVGLAWRGGRGDGLLARMEDLTPQEIARLVQTAEAGFLCLHGPEATADLRGIDAEAASRVVWPADLPPDPAAEPAVDPAVDPATDPATAPEEMLALMACLDAVIATDPQTRALAGAGGCRVWYPAPMPSNRDWGRFTLMETDYRFATATYVDAPRPGDRAGLVKRLAQGIAELARDDLHRRLDRIETLLATEAAGSEALNYEFRRAIVDAEEDILTHRIHRDARYWEIRARVVEKLGVRAEAALCWGQACAQTRTPDPALLRAHWIAQVWAGQPDLAERFGPVDHADLPAEALAHVTTLRNDRIANDLCDEGLHLLAEGQRESAAEQFRQAVRASWQQPDHGAQLEDIVTRLARLDVFANPPAPRREIAMRDRALPELTSYIHHASTLPVQTHRGQADLEPGRPRSVFCSGYIFSGSGAVVDFLRQSAAVTVPGYVDGDIQPFDTELNILRRFYGLQHLLDLPPEQLSIEHLGEFLLGSVLGLIAHPSDRYRLDMSRKRSLRGAFEAIGRMPELIDLCDLLLDTVEAGGGPDSEIILEAACRMVNGLAPRLARPGQPVVLWNNCIQAWNARTLAVMERSVMVAVQRDPRDQYASQFYERGDKDRRNELENFISRTHHHQRMREQLDQIPALRARILDVRFEDVVTDPDTRARLLDFAAIPTDGFREELYFQPSESLRNIGIHRAFPDQDAIGRIAREFPDLLWKG